MSDEMICNCGAEMQVIEIGNESRYGKFISYKIECPMCQNDFETDNQTIHYLANFSRVAGVAYDNLLKENQDLKEKLRIAKEALEFYANAKHASFNTVLDEGLVRTNKVEGIVETGWRARQALKEIKCIE